jgi:hypothetical protein
MSSSRRDSATGKFRDSATGKFVDGKSGLFTVPASSASGERVTISCQVPPTIARRIQDICYEGRATGRWPWRTPGDVHRYLLVVGLGAFATTIDVEDDTVQWHQLSHSVEGLATDREAAEHLHDAICREIDALIRIKADKAATQQLHLLVPDILRVPSQVWREWLVRELRGNYPDLFKRNMPFATLLTLRPDQVFGAPPAATTVVRMRDVKRRTEATIREVRRPRRRKKKKTTT